MRLVLIVFLAIILMSCTTSDYYTVSSPDGSRCITFEYTRSIINPNNEPYVKMYLGIAPINRQQYVKMLWSDIGGVMIDWGSSPIKVRSWLLKENTFPSSLVDVKTETEMSPIENQEFHTKGSTWISYDFTWISAGKYKTCEPK